MKKIFSIYNPFLTFNILGILLCILLFISIIGYVGNIRVLLGIALLFPLLFGYIGVLGISNIIFIIQILKGFFSKKTLIVWGITNIFGLLWAFFSIYIFFPFFVDGLPV